MNKEDDTKTKETTTASFKGITTKKEKELPLAPEMEI